MSFVLTWSSCILTVILWRKTRKKYDGDAQGPVRNHYWGSVTSGNNIPAFGLLEKQALMHLSKGDDWHLFKVIPYMDLHPSSPSSFRSPFTPYFPDPLRCSQEASCQFLRHLVSYFKTLCLKSSFESVPFSTSGSLLVCHHLWGSFPPHVEYVTIINYTNHVLCFLASTFCNDNLCIRAFT